MVRRGRARLRAIGALPAPCAGPDGRWGRRSPRRRRSARRPRRSRVSSSRAIDGVGTEALAPLGCVVAIAPRVVPTASAACRRPSRRVRRADPDRRRTGPDPRSAHRRPRRRDHRTTAFLRTAAAGRAATARRAAGAARTRSASTGTAAARSAGARAGRRLSPSRRTPSTGPSTRGRPPDSAALAAGGRSRALAVVAAASSLVCHGCPIVEVAERPKTPPPRRCITDTSRWRGDREIPAATYSPRGSPPKYHRRWRS